VKVSACERVLIAQRLEAIHDTNDCNSSRVMSAGPATSGRSRRNSDHRARAWAPESTVVNV
jgi:hypothetical protein